jgi:hypothetical protein
VHPVGTLRQPSHLQVLLQFTFKTLTYPTLIDFITLHTKFINLRDNPFVAVKLGVLTHQPPVYIVQMLPTSSFPPNQTTICNHSASCFCDTIKYTNKAFEFIEFIETLQSELAGFIPEYYYKY